MALEKGPGKALARTTRPPHDPETSQRPRTVGRPTVVKQSAAAQYSTADNGLLRVSGSPLSSSAKGIGRPEQPAYRVRRTRHTIATDSLIVVAGLTVLCAAIIATGDLAGRVQRLPHWTAPLVFVAFAALCGMVLVRAEGKR